uniref:NADH dehydrogenase I subunit K n=1 Tax=uncultured prokaryote TaxID=198431 RepID=H5SP93_9ZZZZ|nr:NADH dehydrogenase I subunit K [uncultured prokaryote]
MVGLTHFLILGAMLFCLGLFAVLTRRNAVAFLMGIELMLNSAGINFIAFSRFCAHDIQGHVFAAFIIVLAAAEAAIALAIILAIYHNLKTIEVDKIDVLKG